MPSIVFEYMGEGDLAEFLRSRAPRSKALGTVSDEACSRGLLSKVRLIREKISELSSDIMMHRTN